MDDRDRFDKFTKRARKVLSLAQEESQRFNHYYIGTEHILLGLVREEEGGAAKVLNNLGVDLNKVRNAVEFIINRGDRIVLVHTSFTPRSKKVIELAVDEAHRLNSPYIDNEHLLLGLVREGEGIAAGVLESLGVSLEKVRAQVVEMLGAVDVSPQTVTPSNEEEASLSVNEARQEALKKLEAILNEKEAAIQQQEYGLAAELRNREVQLRDRIAELQTHRHEDKDNLPPS